jgi:hypothetical protein
MTDPYGSQCPTDLGGALRSGHRHNGRMADLPGGLSARRAHLLLRRQQVIGVSVTVVILLAFSGYFVFRGAWPAVALLGLIVVAVSATVYAQRRMAPAEATVGADEQPALTALVGQVATALAVPAPDAVQLTGDTDLGLALRHRHLVLRIGLPLAIALEADELRLLIAHELALLGLPEARLTVAVAAKRRRYVDGAATDSALHGRDAERLIALTQQFAASVERASDEAMVRLAGRAAAARALQRREAVGTAFTAYVLDFAEPPVEHGQAVLDLHEVWADWLAEAPAEDRTNSPDPVKLAQRHPGLADALQGQGGSDVEVRLPADPVPLGPLTGEELARLAGEAVFLPNAGTPVSWVPLSEVDQEVWADEAREYAQAVEEMAAAAVTPAPGSRAELADLVRAHSKELRRVWLELLHGQLEPGAQPAADSAVADPGNTLAALLVATLHERGWRRERSLHPYTLVSPDGERIDAAALGRAAATDAASYKELRDLLV